MYHGALVRLRASEPRDVEAFHTWFNDAEATVGLGVRYPVTRQHERDLVASRGRPSFAAANFSVETHDGRLLGTCGLFDTTPAENQCAELGIALMDKASWGQGYGTDTVRTLCRFGFEEMNLHRIELIVFAQHAAARKVYEKVGFVTEGVARQAHWGDGCWYDDVHMGLLRTDFR